MENNFIENEIDQMKRKVSYPQYIDKEMVMADFKNMANKSSEQLLIELSEDVKKIILEFTELKDENNERGLPGSNISIYMPMKNGEYKLNFYSSINNCNIKIDKNTKFDISSITKLFTLMLMFKLEEFGFICLNDKLSEFDSTYNDFKDFTILDVLLMCEDPRIDGMINESLKHIKNEKEVVKKLEKTILYSELKKYDTYSDIGIMILSHIVEKVISNIYNDKFTFSEIMNHFLLKPYGLHHNTLNKKGIGHTDFFTTNNDLVALAKNMFNVNFVNYNKISHILSEDNLICLRTKHFKDSSDSFYGMCGACVQDEIGNNIFYNSYGENIFSSNGYTRQFAIIETNTLVNPDVFLMTYRKFEEKIIGKSLSIHVARKYYDLIYKENNFRENYTI